MKKKCKKCGHEWDYKGKSKIYVTCPQCYSKIKINNYCLKGGSKKNDNI
jgi:hypothetical protein